MNQFIPTTLHRGKFLALCFCGLLGFVLVQCAQAAEPPDDDFYGEALTAAKALQLWYNDEGLWDTAHWWNDANCLEAIESVVQASNGKDYTEVLRTTFDRNKEKHFLNEYYDDEGWWALAWIRAFDLTGEGRYLAMAKTIFADMKGGWSDHCGGGIWWKKNSHYKNAIANELFLLVAIRLHQRTPGDRGTGSYFDWAQREWTWFDQSGMISAHHMVNDGLDANCNNNKGPTFTYNQGVLIGGLIELFKSTGDARPLAQAISVANASLRTFPDSTGTLQEWNEWMGLHGEDVPQFKGIFARHLAELYDITHEPKYGRFLALNAHSVWLNDRDTTNHLGGLWTGPMDEADAIRHSSAMRLIGTLAEPRTTNLLFIEPAGSPVFEHDVGAAMGASAWKCNATNQSGYLLISPNLESMSVGVHIVHFRFSVDAISQATTNLVSLEVHEGRGTNVLVRRDVRWDEFKEANQPQDFSLSFSHARADEPLQFRVYWKGVTNAPALTMADISVDGFLNLSAASLRHEVGRLDQFDHWRVEPFQNKTSGCLVESQGGTGLPPGAYDVCFELKVDNFNRDDARVATLSVMDMASRKTMGERVLRRHDFSTVLYHTFTLPIKIADGQRLDIRTTWQAGATGPALTQRSLIIRPRGKNP